MEFMDVTDTGCLTSVIAIPRIDRYILTMDHRFKGFLQVYQLQTENDEEETWRDLVCSNLLCSPADRILIECTVQAWF
jgi:hypothetical protein